MAMKYSCKRLVSYERTDVACYSDMEGDGPIVKRITSASPGIKSGIPGFITGFINCKSHFVFSGNREGIENRSNSADNIWGTHNLVSNRSQIFNMQGIKAAENEGSKGDTEMKWGDGNEITKKLGCDGDVEKCVGSTGYLLSSFGAKGDILKPLDEDAMKSFENKNNLPFISRSKDKNESSFNICHDLPKPGFLKHKGLPEKHDNVCPSEVKAFCSSSSEDEIDVHDILTSLVSKHEESYDSLEAESASHNENIISVGGSAVNNSAGEVKLNAYISNTPDSTGANNPSRATDRANKKVNYNQENENFGLKKGVEITCNEETCNIEVPSAEKSIQPVPDTSLIQEKEHNTETEERELLDLYIFEVQQRLAWKLSICEANKNVAALRPDYSYFAKLDSSLKKNTAFARKLKNFTSNQLESLLKDMTSLNLTKYLSEIASALVQAKLKISDVTSAVELCNSIHCMYREFSSYLRQSFQRHLSLKEEGPMINYRKLNVDLKFYAELMNVGILTHEESFPLIINSLTLAVDMDKEEHNNVNVILSFYHHCKEGYAVPRKMRNLAEKYQVTLPKCNLLLETEMQNVKLVLKDYYTSLMDHVIKVHHEVKVYEHQNKKIILSRGELSTERKGKWEVLKLLNEKLLCALRNLAAELDEEMPNLTNSNCEKNNLHVIDAIEEEQGSVIIMWEDEEEQHFYEVLTDMKEFIHSPSSEIQIPVMDITEDEMDTQDEESEEDSITEDKSDETNEVDECEPGFNVNNTSSMETFVTSLSYCINCDTVEKLAVEFLMSLNNKRNRIKLVKALLGVPRTRLDLLPFYARLAATLHPLIPDICLELCQHLKQEFKYHVRKKDQINIESKIKVVRFIGELVKFRIYSRFEALYCLKLLLRDFSHHHIEMCCTLLESCGRFLFRNSDSHQRTEVYLEEMMRKKSVTALDSRYVTMIENAFFYVDPPTIPSLEKKEQRPIYEFIQKIIYQDLSKSSTEIVLQLMCKVDWENSELMEFCIGCLIMAYNVKYNNIGYLASIVSGLVCEEEESVGVLVVDGVMEDVRLGMEVNLPKYNQRRLAMVKYIGELYKYRVAESNDIFKVLYSLISFGVNLNYSNPSYLDPPGHLFRIRLVCVLLETCGQYFNHGISVKKLDYYLIYFQRYFWFKYEDKYWNINDNPFPVGIQYLFQDTLLNLHLKVSLFTSFEAANQAVHQMQIVLASKLIDVIPWLFSSNDEILPALRTDLVTIVEEELEEPEVRCNMITTSIEETHFNLSVTGNLEDMGNCELDYTIQREGCLKDLDVIGSSITHEVHDTSIFKTVTHIFMHTESSEDEGFVTAFDKMVSENIQNRMMEVVKPQYIDIPVPLHFKSGTRKSYGQIQQTKLEEKSTVSFVLLVRKGHKQHYKCLHVPIESELAVKLKTGEEAERAEKEHVKQLTLDMNQRLEEESYQEMLTQAQKAVLLNINHDRRYKYHYPKGAPDADLIFGAKKFR